MKIETKNLVKIYGHRRVVNDISFEINKGEVVGLLGPNGAGKTTTFYMVVGLVKPNKGEVLLDGKDITKMPMHLRARAGIGYLPQEASSFRSLSVEDNIKLVLQMNDKLSEDEKKQKLEDLLDEFGVKKLRKEAAISLSGGERRRVELARALAASPDFILLDEPFTGIDPIAIGEIKENIRTLSVDKGLGVLITDHNPKATLSITDRAYVIFDGKIKIQGRSIDVANDPVAKKHYLGEDFKL
ncbi:MAG TPA: LPS export ABC transporter ATP-binding protein [Cyanobacteria bacterium UBA11991]|nr:LPS export ABC transporter ATP-binding protein [Cyanobacteriota bacterium]MDY6358751.1 LPS export ABC transporter ATP-binding protein [Cyanobacteriota bacterium]MDY6363324.1 LPS export ABC transporter ATP-binding protein [Cyanobacteriota bacterium]HCB11565.1 LPS export ABC transporter ATP-binding protein [Cyanobacteria bacterium UBA11991]